jgi:hypothetical protein
MITILQETTDWVYSGIYHVNAAGHLVGYQGAGDYKEFSEPMKRFSKSRRKFKKIGTREEVTESDVESWNVAGSKPGVNYVVTRRDDKITCTCPGATYRGHCKHIAQLESIG